MPISLLRLLDPSFAEICNVFARFIRSDKLGKLQNRYLHISKVT